jgi:hypothetical protein
MSVVHTIQPLLQKFQVQHLTSFRNVLCGGGICYAIEQKNFWHLPAVIIFPSIYAGYQGYKNREQILNFMKSKL